MSRDIPNRSGTPLGDVPGYPEPECHSVGGCPGISRTGVPLRLEVPGLRGAEMTGVQRVRRCAARVVACVVADGRATTGCVSAAAGASSRGTAMGAARGAEFALAVVGVALAG